MICVEILPPSGFIKYHRHMLRIITLFLALTATALGQNSAKDEAQVWELEKAYWEYVKANDLEKYRALWHENFVGWPFAFTGEDMPPMICQVPCVRVHVCVIRNLSVLTSAPVLFAHVALIR